MKIYFASDHAGFALKNTLTAYVRSLGYDVEDCGPDTYDENDDYPKLVRPVADKVTHHIDSKGIILGGSGQGEAIVANRHEGIRAAVYYGGPEEIIILSRLHNNANVLSLGARFLDEDEAKSAVKLWLETHFIGEERHVRRITQIDVF